MDWFSWLSSSEAPSVFEKTLALARAAGEAGEVPVGAVVWDLQKGICLGEGKNRREERHDPTSHAEIEALRAAAKKLRSWRVPHLLVTTLEPCPMCFEVLSQARVRAVIYGARDLQGGALRRGVETLPCPFLFYELEESQKLLVDFFQKRRQKPRSLKK